MEEKERYVKYDLDNDGIITRTIYDTIEEKPSIVPVDRCIDLLIQQLAITEKALELCERHHIGFEESTLKEQVDWRETRIKENIEYFKTKAKEMLENE